jgi:hypothetical protein
MQFSCPLGWSRATRAKHTARDAATQSALSCRATIYDEIPDPALTNSRYSVYPRAGGVKVQKGWGLPDVNAMGVIKCYLSKRLFAKIGYETRSLTKAYTFPEYSSRSFLDI